MASMDVHPTARTWRLPPARAPLAAPLARTNLRELAAREGRLEHHLTIVARIGPAQLEVVTASEPLFFAHQNVSDEHVIALATGDALMDSMPLRTFLSDPASGEDAARLNHRVHDLILHPYGWSHWPGRLRPPFTPPAFPPAIGRRTGLSMVFCGAVPVAPAPDRRAVVSPGREDDAKAYRADAPPLGIVELGRAPLGPLAAIGDVTLSLAAPPFAPARGGIAILLEGDAEAAFAGDLVWIPPGASWDPPVARALLAASPSAGPEPPPRVWSRVPEPPFAEPPEGALPCAIGAIRLAARSASEVDATLDGVTTRLPRYWLARMLWRIAVHTAVLDGERAAPRPCLGHVETYGGFFYDDRDGAFRFGLRGAPATTTVAPEALLSALARAWAAVRPEGHDEDPR